MMLRRSTLFTLVAAVAVIAAGLFFWLARPVQATGVKLQYAPLVRTLTKIIVVTLVLTPHQIRSRRLAVERLSA